MTALVFAGLGGFAAFGMLLVFRGVVAPPVPLSDLISDLHRPRTTQPQPTRHRDRLVGLLAGSSHERRDQDLAVCDRTETDWAAVRMTSIIIGITPGLGLYLLGANGLLNFVSARTSLVMLVLGAVGGWFFALVELRSEADKARREFRHAIAAYLRLVTILISGGAGPESAMIDAAEAGTGIAFGHIRSGLASAQMRREDPWVALGRIGRALGIDELVELEAKMRLAAAGAQVTASLATSAKSILAKDLAAIESEAEARSEKMELPAVLMVLGFMVLMAYPALAGLTAV